MTRFVVRGAVAVAIALAPILLPLGGSAAAQPTDRLGNPSHPVSQLLLRRLGESVAGQPPGRPVWVVARYDSLSPVAGTFAQRDSAVAMARRLGEKFDVFGPFVPDPADGVSVQLGSLLFLRCTHIASALEPPPSPYCPAEVVPLADVRQMSLVIQLRDSTITVPIGREADAVFLSLSALEKFAFPYYARIIGVDAAAAMRRGIVGRATALSRR